MLLVELWKWVWADIAGLVPIVTEAIGAKSFAFYCHGGLERSTQGLNSCKHNFSELLLFLLSIEQVGK